jgi:hypothetical protein
MPRESLRHLFAQYVQYGYWKARILQKHRLPASVRHLIPSIFVFTLALLPVARSALANRVVGMGCSARESMSPLIFSVSVLTASSNGLELVSQFFRAFLRYSTLRMAGAF